MDPIENPYTPNAGSRPPELTGRDAELQAFRILIGRLKRGHTEQSLIVRGLRGMGKTVLLNAFEDIANDADFRAFYHELTQESALIDLLVRDARRSLEHFSLKEKTTSALRGALGRLRTIRLGALGFELEVDLKGASEGDITEDVTELLLAVGRAADEAGSGVVFLLDELQFAPEMEYRALISGLHRVNQKSLPVTMAGAGLPQIPRLSGDARSYAERLFDFRVIGALDAEDAASAIIEPARREGVEYTSDALARAIEWTDGYPYFIQQLGKQIWNAATASPITESDVRRAIPAAQIALDNALYEVRIQRATDGERRYMRAMAELGSGPYRAGQIAKLLARKTSDLSVVRQRLLEKGLVYATEDHGYLDFTVPRFDEFMRRHMSFDR